MKNIFKVIFVIIGAFIGAGFASGQEIYVFFFSHGLYGLIGLFISGIILGTIISKTLKIIKENNIENYKQFLNVIINTSKKIKQNKKFINTKIKNDNSKFKLRNENSKVAKSINFIVNAFILVTFFIMIAGFGTYFSQEFGINQILGSSILAIITYIVLNKNVKGVVKANEIIVPILIILVIIIGLINFKEIQIFQIKNYLIANYEISFILDSILYASYNSILLIPVLITLNKYIKSKKNVKIISIVSSMIIIVLSTLIFFILTKVDVNIENLEMPAVYVVSNMSKLLKNIYGFIILGSIFTTAISLGISFLQNIEKNKKSYTQIALIMCITSVIVSKIGFSNLVNLLYPIFGYLGLLQIWKILRI